MNVLFDASALLNVLRLKKGDALKYFKGSYLLNLTPYEVGNALWKEATILRIISLEEALTLLHYLKKAYKIMKSIEPHSSEAVLKLSHELRITYYDSAYIVAASENELALVTDDTKLINTLTQRRNEATQILARVPKLITSKDLVSDT